MARSRNIKPSIMDNEELADLEPLTRLLFVYLWMLADREGRLEDRPKRIAAQALPYDRSADVGAMLDDLHKAGFIARYTADGVACIQILSFTKHQSPHVREAASSLPCMEQGTTKAVPEHNLGSAEASPRSPDSGFLIPDSLIPDVRMDAHPPPRTPAGEACVRMKAAGLQAVNPSHPKLVALLQAGITPEELADAAVDAVAKGKPLAYALATAEGRRRDAATQPLPDKPGPTVPARAGPDPTLARMDAERAEWKPPPAEVKALLAETAKRLKGAIA